MREIKFRGRRLDDMAWAHGDLHKEYRGEAFIMTYEGKSILSIDDIDNLFYNVSVDPMTIGQFTGLKDKHCKEIYEGDIIKWRPITGADQFFKGIVRWCKVFACFAIYSINYRDFPYEMDWVKVLQNGLEVIGNIYDNPELLED